MAGTEPIPVRFRNTGWGTLRRPFALVSIENVVIVTESCEMTVVRLGYITKNYHIIYINSPYRMVHLENSTVLDSGRRPQHDGMFAFGCIILVRR